MRPTGNQMLISLIMRVCDRQQTRDWNKFLHFTYSIEVLKKKKFNFKKYLQRPIDMLVEDWHAQYDVGLLGF